MGFTFTRTLKDVFPTPIIRLFNLASLFMLSGMLLSYMVGALLSFTGIGHEGYAILSIQVLGFLAAGYCFNRIRKINGRAQLADLALCSRCLAPAPIDSDAICTTCSLNLGREPTKKLWRGSIFTFGSPQVGPRPKGTKYIPWWAIPIFTAAGVATTIVIVFLDFKLNLNIPVASFTFVMFGMYILGVILVFLTRRKASRLSRLAREHDFLICESCRYPLGEVQGRDVCPECGAAFDRYHLRRRWFESYGAFHVQKAAELDVPIGISRPFVTDEAIQQ